MVSYWCEGLTVCDAAYALSDAIREYSYDGKKNGFCVDGRISFDFKDDVYLFQLDGDDVTRLDDIVLGIRLSMKTSFDDNSQKTYRFHLSVSGAQERCVEIVSGHPTVMYCSKNSVLALGSTSNHVSLLYFSPKKNPDFTGVDLSVVSNFTYAALRPRGKNRPNTDVDFKRLVPSEAPSDLSVDVISL